MLKALFKKQLAEINTWFFNDKKTGKRRKTSGLVLYAVLYFFVFAVMVGMFAAMAVNLCLPFSQMGLDWFYHSIMCSVAVMFGIIGSAFTTFSTLYTSKDNELLLSMPIPPSYILTVRLFGVWFWGVIYASLVLIPSSVVYWIQVDHSPLVILLDVLLIPVLSVFVLALSCILGWVVAKVSAKIKSKSFVTVLLSLAFIGIYYYVYFRASELLSQLIVNAQSLSIKVKGAAYPLYIMGKWGMGDGVAFAICTAGIALVFFVVWYVMSRSFLKLATTSGAVAKKVYREEKAKKQSVGTALLKKEFARLTSSSIYMLNCALGAIFLPILSVLAVVKMDLVRNAIVGLFMQEAEIFPDIEGFLALLVCAAVCTMSSMIDLTAPSVSLEGNRIWLLQSLPVSPWQVLRAKLTMHISVALPPVVLACGVLSFVIGLGVVNTVLAVLCSSVFAVFMAFLGLVLNLKLPCMVWKNETVPVKQSASVTISLFAGWVIVVILGFAYFALESVISPRVFIILATALLALLSAGMYVLVKKWGSKVFASL